MTAWMLWAKHLSIIPNISGYNYRWDSVSYANKSMFQICYPYIPYTSYWHLTLQGQNRTDNFCLSAKKGSLFYLFFKVFGLTCRTAGRHSTTEAARLVWSISFENSFESLISELGDDHFFIASEYYCRGLYVQTVELYLINCKKWRNQTVTVPNRFQVLCDIQ